MCEQMKPCPHCGGKPVLRKLMPKEDYTCRGEGRIKCSQCGFVMWADVDFAIEAWNRYVDRKLKNTTISTSEQN